MIETANEAREKRFPYVCAVKTKPSLSRLEREDRAEKRLGMALYLASHWLNFRDLSERIAAARQAEHPVAGVRLAESSDFDLGVPGQLEVAARYNGAHRHVKRHNRKATMRQRARRGRR